MTEQNERLAKLLEEIDESIRLFVMKNFPSQPIGEGTWRYSINEIGYSKIRRPYDKFTRPSTGGKFVREVKSDDEEDEGGRGRERKMGFSRACRECCIRGYETYEIPCRNLSHCPRRPENEHSWEISPGRGHGR